MNGTSIIYGMPWLEHRRPQLMKPIANKSCWTVAWEELFPLWHPAFHTTQPHHSDPLEKRSLQGEGMYENSVVWQIALWKSILCVYWISYLFLERKLFAFTHTDWKRCPIAYVGFISFLAELSNTEEDLSHTPHCLSSSIQVKHSYSALCWNSFTEQVVRFADKKFHWTAIGKKPISSCTPSTLSVRIIPRREDDLMKNIIKPYHMTEVRYSDMTITNAQ